MNEREASIISAYTGYLIGDFATFHKYVEEIMDRPVWTHELADEETVRLIQKKAKADFLAIDIEEE